MNRLLTLLAPLLVVLTTTANAAPIQGLFNTGLDGSGNVVSPFTANGDANYTLSGAGLVPAQANVIQRNPAWVVAPTGSEWIGLNNGSQDNPDGLANIFTFRTTFDLTGLDHTTASISGQGAVDNRVQIFLNNTLNDGFAGFSSLFSFNVNSGFVAGINVLEFRVENIAFSGTNPMGLLISSLSGTADEISAVPVPAALPLLLTSLVGLVLVSRRRKARLA